jgi:hypothetical protein
MEINGRNRSGSRNRSGNPGLDGRDRVLTHASRQMDRWEAEQLFEEDLRSVLQLLRPHRRERLLGWKEHRTGGAGFRVTVSWDGQTDKLRADADDADDVTGPLVVPKMADVIESLLVGSAKHQDELLPSEEFALYRDVLHEVHRRLDEMQACYE